MGMSYQHATFGENWVGHYQDIGVNEDISKTVGPQSKACDIQQQIYSLTKIYLLYT